MMAAGLDRAELQRLARLGAKARLEELEQERTALLRAFPGLRATASPAGNGASVEQSTRRRRRRRMSREGRKRISETMKKRWAERRKAGKAAAQR
jgi:hypothetical protein